MAISFMAILAIAIEERLDAKGGALLLLAISSPSALSVSCCGAGPAICGCIAGYSFSLRRGTGALCSLSF